MEYSVEGAALCIFVPEKPIVTVGNQMDNFRKKGIPCSEVLLFFRFYWNDRIFLYHLLEPEFRSQGKRYGGDSITTKRTLKIALNQSIQTGPNSRGM